VDRRGIMRTIALIVLCLIIIILLNSLIFVFAGDNPFYENVVTNVYSASISPIFEEFTPSYRVECTGNEIVLCDYLKYQIILNNDSSWNRTSFNILLDKISFIKEELDNRTGMLINLTIIPKLSYPLKIGSIVAKPTDISANLVKGGLNTRPTFEEGDKLEYTFELPPNTRWAKFGDMSIYIIQDSYASASADLNNVTAELGNFTHLNISKTSPYDSLVGYWNFDNDKGNQTAYDFAGNNNGAYVGNAWSNSTCGIYGNGACFDGGGGLYKLGRFGYK
jgi:hypothetical protein